ncbi:flavin reductase family protein [Streptomyces sp. NPDC090106]|uniref:flavin reductase family protein n=1 Tax=Streptomyces sp. NPDC090106 TaxID=3365946 RepID=UPI0038212D58
MPTSVVVVTATGADGQPVGLAIGSFTSISLDPPLVGFFPTVTSTSWPLIRQSGHFCVNVLAHNQTDIAARFARSGGDKFQGLSHSPAEFSGAPVLDDVIAWIDCELDMAVELGDHYLVVGKVRSMQSQSSDHPLIFLRGGYPAPR